MSRSILHKVVTVTAFAPLALAAACGGGTKAATAGGTGSSQDIVLGASLSQTGPLGSFGVNLDAGYQQRISEVNAAGGLAVAGTKHHVTLTVLDNRSDPNTATQQIRELVLKDHAVALLGACTPPIVVPEALAAEQQKVPIVSSCNPVMAFQAGDASGWKYSWDLFFNEKDQASQVTQVLATSTGNKKVALFTDSEPDGVAERGLFKAAFATAGLDVVGDYSFPVGTTDFSSFIADAKSKGATLLAGQMIPPDGIALWKQMKALSFSPGIAYVAKASTGLAWPKALGATAEGTVTQGFWSPVNGEPGSAKLETTLGAKYPGDFADLDIAVLGYTVVSIVTDGITAAGSTDPAKVNEAIGQTNAHYPLGSVTFGPNHTSTTPNILMQWQNGSIVQILPSVPGVTLQTPTKGLS